jgi:hypothetical protein
MLLRTVTVVFLLLCSALANAAPRQTKQKLPSATEALKMLCSETDKTLAAVRDAFLKGRKLDNLHQVPFQWQPAKVNYQKYPGNSQAYGKTMSRF